MVAAEGIRPGMAVRIHSPRRQCFIWDARDPQLLRFRLRQVRHARVLHSAVQAFLPFAAAFSSHDLQNEWQAMATTVGFVFTLPARSADDLPSVTAGSKTRIKRWSVGVKSVRAATRRSAPTL